MPIPALSSAPIDNMAASKFEKTCLWIPIIGWAFGATLVKQRFEPVVRSYKDILGKRNPEDVKNAWSDTDRSTFSQLAPVLKAELGWEAEKFIPNDPLKVVFWAHEDGLDDVEALNRIEKLFAVKFSEAELKALSEETLGAFVSSIQSKQDIRR